MAENVKTLQNSNTKALLATLEQSEEKFMIEMHPTILIWEVKSQKFKVLDS
ncbi:MAG: hypothetical protein KME30_16200 [Iphinoe sp. HA4291-MV1]|jgi:hypothetical protein|nr:hypothetical protein [Iphinoe sp. HA4291-MV1]